MQHAWHKSVQKLMEHWARGAHRLAKDEAEAMRIAHTFWVRELLRVLMLLARWLTSGELRGASCAFFFAAPNNLFIHFFSKAPGLRPPFPAALQSDKVGRRRFGGASEAGCCDASEFR